MIQEYFDKVDGNHVFTVAATAAAGLLLAYLSKRARTIFTQGTTAVIVLFLSILTFAAWGVSRIHAGQQFANRYESNVLAAHNTDDMTKAHKYIKRAREYLEGQGNTKGYTSCLYESPDEDVSELYDAVKDVESSLEKAVKGGDNPTDSAWRKWLERKGLVAKKDPKDAECKTYKVEIPSGISVHPYNSHYSLAAWGSLFSTIISAIWTCIVAKVNNW